MNSPQTSQRFHDLDALRAFAMLLGILLHAMMSFISMPVNISVAQDVQQNSSLYSYLLHSIHGFRMPLFFLVSGFFTTMMWRKRGSIGLVKHRLLRIGVPLLIGFFTLVPMILAMGILWNQNVWFAASKGDIRYVSHYVEAGNDIDARMYGEGIPGHGATALHIASFSEHVPIIQFLIDEGADINAGTYDSTDGSPSLQTPLHWVAINNRLEIVDLLLESGADVNRRDSSGQTPLDTVAALESSHSDVIERLKDAGGLLGKDLPPQELQSEEPNWGKDPFTAWVNAQSGLMSLLVMFCFLPPLAHLWFLWYLLWLVAAFVLLMLLRNRSPLTKSSFQNLSSLKVWCVLIGCTLLPQLFMLQSFGADTASGILPWPPTLAYYSVFFFFGAFCYDRHHVLFRLANRWRWMLVLAMAILPLGAFAVHERTQNFLLYQSISAVVASLYAWLMIFGMLGLFQHFFSKKDARIRYVSDSAYWLYLMHLPLVYALQIWMSDWMIPSYAKLLLICGITSVVLMASYHWLVRYTWIGTLLNGKKHRPVIEQPSEGSVVQQTA